MIEPVTTTYVVYFSPDHGKLPPEPVRDRVPAREANLAPAGAAIFYYFGQTMAEVTVDGEAVVLSAEHHTSKTYFVNATPVELKHLPASVLAALGLSGYQGGCGEIVEVNGQYCVYDPETCEIVTTEVSGEAEPAPAYTHPLHDPGDYASPEPDGSDVDEGVDRGFMH